MPNLTLTAPTIALPAAVLPPGTQLRQLAAQDAADLGQLYVRSYPPDVIDGMDADAAIGDMVDTFNGAYGVIMPEATLGAFVAGHLVAVVMTVAQSPWDDLPRGPLIIEVFADPAHRRRGLARAVLLAAMRVISPRPVSLRVSPDNAAALALYRSLGFVDMD
jgi:GNAT superfamily N-acetyltransferase